MLVRRGYIVNVTDSPPLPISADGARLMTEADAARTSRDFAGLIRIGGELERLGHYREAWLALAEGAEIRRGTLFPNWGGSGSAGKRLLIRRRIRHLGAELRNARFIGCALRDIDQVVVATEPRLIPLLKRSFPAADFIDVDTLSDIEGIEVECSYERLALLYGPDEATIRQSFVPLVPPQAMGIAPEGLGISWHSSNSRKPLPMLEDWASALATVNQPIQSLQYDEKNAGMDRLSLLSGRNIRPSHPVDQMVDVDQFARQVASVRAVLTISNTPAHMAGALGIPCVILLDDMQHLTWPAAGNLTPFYPTVRLLRHNGRAWTQVVQEGLQTVRSLIHL